MAHKILQRYEHFESQLESGTHNNEKLLSILIEMSKTVLSRSECIYEYKQIDGTTVKILTGENRILSAGEAIQVLREQLTRRVKLIDQLEKILEER